jgi:ABC-2 type transport system ATP-binding protein
VSGAAILAADVSKRFGSVQSLDGLALRVPAGAVFGFLGPNGAGKTTTLRALLGLVAVDQGRLEVLGLDPKREARRIRAQVGVLLESDGLYDRLTAAQNLDYHGRIHHLAPAALAARAEELLGAFGLWERRRDSVVTWSKGMRQKLAIARALLHRPRLLLLDEPFSGLDPVAASDLRTEIVRLARDQQVTVLLTTHDLAHVEKACDEVAVIRAGRVIATGRPGELGERSSDVVVEVAGAGLDAALLDKLCADGLILRHEADGPRARVWCTPEQRPRLGRELVERGVVLEELHTVRASLEEAFLSLVGR